MNGAGIARSILVVVAAVLLLGFIDQTLEQTMVQALANAPIKDEAAYLAIRNRPMVLAIIVATHAVASLLTGYVLAKLAGTHEVQHAAATAAFATLLLIAASITPNVMVPPAWVRLAMAAITPAALIAGAYVRGQARLIREERTLC
jgi:hypothetical protein